MLKFTAFDVHYTQHQNHILCGRDYLTITDGDGAILMEKSCGSANDGPVKIGSQLIFTLPPDVRSRSNIVNLEFSTDNSGVRTGWIVTWNAMTPSGKRRINKSKN